jgi:hypothetical protein
MNEARTSDTVTPSAEMLSDLKQVEVNGLLFTVPRMVVIEIEWLRRELEKAQSSADETTERQAAMEDRAYCNGAQQAAAMAHQSLKAMDEWILSGCGGRSQQALAVLRSAEQPPIDNAHVAEGCEQFAGVRNTVEIRTFTNHPPATCGVQTPICSKCGQIDVRIPRMGIYHVCPPQTQITPEEPESPRFKTGDRVQNESGSAGVVLSTGTERAQVQYDDGRIREPLLTALRPEKAECALCAEGMNSFADPATGNRMHARNGVVTVCTAQNGSETTKATK